MAEILEYLKRAAAEKASDLFVVAGYPVGLKRGGRILPAGEARLLPPQTEQLLNELYELAGRSMANYLREYHDNFSFAVPGLARFRVGAYRQRGSMAAVIRVVTFEIPGWESLHIPEAVMSLADMTHGLVLVTGGAGSGKSTTQACMIDRINQTRNCHVITVEDPIEFLHRNQKSVISQQEVGLDVEDSLSALQLCVWQAPDVILLDRMEDWRTAQAAISLAETGHLLIVTVRTWGAVDAIAQIIDSFPAGQQAQARFQLSRALRAVISQQLLPGKEGGLLPAFELMRMNSSIQSMIREGRNGEIESAIEGGNGMISMDQSIFNLYREGKITIETALSCAGNPDQMRRRCG